MAWEAVTVLINEWAPTGQILSFQFRSDVIERHVEESAFARRVRHEHARVGVEQGATVHLHDLFARRPPHHEERDAAISIVEVVACPIGTDAAFECPLLRKARLVVDQTSHAVMVNERVTPLGGPRYRDDILGLAPTLGAAKLYALWHQPRQNGSNMPHGTKACQ